MDQITNVNSVSFKANQPVKEQTEQEKPVNQVQVENGDEKSMDALKWAGIIGAGALAAAAITTSVIKGKGINSKYVDMQKLAKTGIAELNDEGKKAFENKKILKFIQGIGKDGSIKKAKIVSDDASKLQTFIKNGKRFSQKATVDGKKVKLWYDSNNKLAKTVKGGVKTTFEYGTEGANKGKLIKKVTNGSVQEFKYDDKGNISSIMKDGQYDKTFTWIDRGENQKSQLHSIVHQDKVQKFKSKNGKLIAQEVQDLNGKTLSKYHVNRDKNGKVLSTISATYGDDGKIIYKSDGNVLTKQSKLIDNQMHTTVTFGDNTAVQVLDKDYKPVKIIFNNQELDPKGKNIYQLIGLTDEQFDKFFADMSKAGI